MPTCHNGRRSDVTSSVGRPWERHVGGALTCLHSTQGTVSCSLLIACYVHLVTEHAALKVAKNVHGRGVGVAWALSSMVHAGDLVRIIVLLLLI